MGGKISQPLVMGGMDLSVFVKRSARTVKTRDRTESATLVADETWLNFFGR
jgi:hypothetical protein